MAQARGRASGRRPHSKKEEKVQTAIEYLSSYSWALIILVIVIVAVSFLAFNHQASTYLPSTCYISTSFDCQQMFVMSNSTGAKALIIFTNNYASNVMFSANAFGIEPGTQNSIYSGQCYPAVAVPGSSVTCTAFIPSYSPGMGSELSPRIALSYSVCSGSNCQQQQQLNVSGTSTVYVSPFAPTQIVTLLTNTGSGKISLNGVNYPSGTKYAFVNGIYYNVYANPPSGLGFASWVVTNGVNVDVANGFTIDNPQISVNATGVGTLIAEFIGANTPTVSCQKYNPLQGQSNNCTTTEAGSPDNLYLCTGSNANLNASNLTSACNAPYNYWIGFGSGNATFNTDSLPAGAYYFEGCDDTYYGSVAPAQTDCSQAVEVLITPSISLSVQKPMVFQGSPDSVTASSANSNDLVVLCSSYAGMGRVYACAGANNEVGSATGSYTNTLTTFPVGTFKFAACDWSYYQNTSMLDCSPVQNVTIIPQPPNVTFSCQSDNATYLQSDQCTGSATYNGAGAFGANDIIDVCGDSATVGGINSIYQGVPPFVDKSICGNNDIYVQNNAMGTVHINLKDYYAGTYRFKACDQSYRLEYNVSATNSSACSPEVNVTVGQPACSVLQLSPASGDGGTYTLHVSTSNGTDAQSGNCPTGSSSGPAYYTCRYSGGDKLNCNYLPGTRVSITITPNSGYFQSNVLGSCPLYSYRSYDLMVGTYDLCSNVDTPTGTYTGSITTFSSNSVVAEDIYMDTDPPALQVSCSPSSTTVDVGDSVTYTATFSDGWPSVGWYSYCGGQAWDMPCKYATCTPSDCDGAQATITGTFNTAGSYSGTMTEIDSSGAEAVSNTCSATVSSPVEDMYDQDHCEYVSNDGSANCYAGSGIPGISEGEQYCFPPSQGGQCYTAYDCYSPNGQLLGYGNPPLGPTDCYLGFTNDGVHAQLYGTGQQVYVVGSVN